LAKPGSEVRNGSGSEFAPAALFQPQLVGAYRMNAGDLPELKRVVGVYGTRLNSRPFPVERTCNAWYLQPVFSLVQNLCTQFRRGAQRERSR
jgi:hypothetical protein